MRNIIGFVFFWFFLLTSAPPLFDLQRPALAGKVNSDGGIELRVSFRYNAPKDHLDKWRAAYESASKLIYDATDGQFYIKKIKVCNDSQGGKQADVFIHDGTDTAYVSYTGLMEGEQLTKEKLGINVSAVRIYHYLDDITVITNKMTSGHVPAHELAHYVFGLLDEYKGPGGVAECLGSATAPACLMENYRSNGPISEFCVASNHDPDTDTFQHAINAESCWQSINRIWAKPLPANLPVDDPPGNLPALEWEELTTRRAVLVIDRSGSMSGDRIAGAKNGASLAVDLLQVGDELSVVSFSDDARTDLSLTTITANTVKDAAKNIINNLNVSGFTNIGGGLREALNQIKARPKEACVQFIILLTDGMHNTGEGPERVLPDLKAAGIPVFTIGLGSDADSALLSQIANETGGKFLSASASDVADIFATLQAEAFGNSTVTVGAQEVGANEQASIQSRIDGATTQATFLISWMNRVSDLDLKLRAPNGLIITGTAPPSNVEFFSTQSARGFKVTGPPAGDWQLLVNGLSVSGKQKFNYKVFAESPSVLFEAASTQAQVTAPAPIAIFAHADHFTPVTNLAISGQVMTPSGTQIPITLFDDGKREHGDLFAGDGLYGALFNQYTTAGSYTFNLTADNLAGQGKRGIGDEPGVPPSVTPVIPFVRVAQFSVPVVSVQTSANLELKKTAQLTGSGSNLRINYQITVTNLGPNEAANVVITDNLPAGTSFVSCNAPGGVCNGTGNNRTITFSALPVGATANLTLVAAVNCAGITGNSLSNTATVTSSASDSNTANNTATDTINLPPAQAKVTLDNGSNALEFGPVMAAREVNPNPPARLLTLENTGCQPLGVSFAFRRTGPEVTNGKVVDPDDQATFQIRAINTDGTETPVTDAQIFGGQSRRFRVLFNPLIPAPAGGTSNLFASQVIPELINSTLTITPNTGAPLNVPLVGRVTTDAKLINPLAPRLSPLVVLINSAANEFTVEFSAYDANLDIYYVVYQFLDGADLPVGDAPGFSLDQEIQAKGLVKGQSFTVIKRFSGAFARPNVRRVRVTLYDRQGNAVATSGPIGTQHGRVVNVSAASFSVNALARGAIVAAFGQRLATTTTVATTTPLPTRLAGTQVFVTDSHMVERPAPLFFVAPGQINYQIPLGTAPGTATVTVAAGDGALSLGTINVLNVAPAFFTANSNGQGVPTGVLLRVRADGAQSFEPLLRYDQTQQRYVALPIDLGNANEQVYLVLFGTGWRNRGAGSPVTARAVAVNSPVPANMDLPVLYLGPQGSLVGVDQANLRLPRTLLGRGEVEITLTVEGRASNPVRVVLR